MVVITSNEIGIVWLFAKVSDLGFLCFKELVIVGHEIVDLALYHPYRLTWKYS